MTGQIDDTGQECGTLDTVDGWFCFVAPCTGAILAELLVEDKDAVLPGANPWPVTLSIFSVERSLPHQMLSCTERSFDPVEDGEVTSGETSEEVSRQIQRSFWPAVTGNRYLIRVGMPSGQSTEGVWGAERVSNVYLRLRCTGQNSCGMPYTGPCFSDNQGIAGCDDTSCCNAVCAEDPYCCNIEWDGACASRAQEVCSPQD